MQRTDPAIMVRWDAATSFDKYHVFVAPRHVSVRRIFLLMTCNLDRAHRQLAEIVCICTHSLVKIDNAFKISLDIKGESLW